MSRSKVQAFTLVELLVVIGIIALLVGVLLPTLSKARESARQIKCMANMKQIAWAVIQYAMDNRSIMPGRGASPPCWHNLGNPAAGTWDFIAWQRRIDPVTGRYNGTGPADLKITHSALAKYLGNTEQVLEAVFRCPSDNLFQRPNATSLGAFRYSYSMNSWVSSREGRANLRRLSAIPRPAERIMLVCEDEKTLDDGYYNMEGDKLNDWLSGVSCNVLASRHELKSKRARGIVWTGDKTTSLADDCRGNVAFCDGHVQIFTRKDALRPRYTGSNAKDNSP